MCPFMSSCPLYMGYNYMHYSMGKNEAALYYRQWFVIRRYPLRQFDCIPNTVGYYGELLKIIFFLASTGKQLNIVWIIIVISRFNLSQMMTPIVYEFWTLGVQIFTWTAMEIRKKYSIFKIQNIWDKK
jgi:hypothetical protein